MLDRRVADTHAARPVSAWGIIMARSSALSRSATSRDIAQIGKLLHDLEGHLAHLAKSVAADAREVGSNVPDLISDAFSEISDRFRTTIQSSTRNVSAEAARVGSGAWHRVEDEVANHPLTALAIAAGIGFLIGALNRR
jgi:ElaB/YqjD/DUF883 family membrane-anchored ribosome-binding protein